MKESALLHAGPLPEIESMYPSDIKNEILLYLYLGPVP